MRCNEIIDRVDLVHLVGTYSKDIDPGYEAVSLRRPASLDNDHSLTCCPSKSTEILIPESCKHERTHFVSPLTEVLLSD